MAVLGAGWDLDNDLPFERSQTFPGLRVAIGRIAEGAIEVHSGFSTARFCNSLACSPPCCIYIVSARNRPPCGERLPCIVSPQRFREHTK